MKNQVFYFLSENQISFCIGFPGIVGNVTSICAMAARRTITDITAHRHKLQKVDPQNVYPNTDSWGCDLCKETFHQSNVEKPYHCVSNCEFDLCGSCMKGKTHPVVFCYEIIGIHKVLLRFPQVSSLILFLAVTILSNS